MKNESTTNVGVVISNTGPGIGMHASASSPGAVGAKITVDQNSKKSSLLARVVGWLRSLFGAGA